MFIHKKQPVRFVNGEIFNPESWNENLSYAKKAIREKADMETYRWTSTFSLVKDVSTPTTNSTGIEYRKIHIPPSNFRNTSGNPVDVDFTIESVAITAYYTATNPFTITVYGETENKTITLPARDSSLATTPFDLVELMNITAQRAGELLLLSPVGGTSIEKMDVTVGFASNKYDCGFLSSIGIFSTTKPDINTSFYDKEATDETTLNATTFSSLQAHMNSLALNAIKGSASRWSHVEFSDFIKSDIDGCLFRPIPGFTKASFASIETAANMVGIYVTGYYSSAITAYGTINFGICDNSGSIISGFSSSKNFGVAATPTFFQEGLLKDSFTSNRYTGTPNDLTQDLYFYAYVTAGTNAIIKKLQFYLIVQ